MPRDRAVMPYWVPQGLRSQKKWGTWLWPQNKRRVRRTVWVRAFAKAEAQDAVTRKPHSRGVIEVV